MKTSFYNVLFILIYQILVLFGSSIIGNHVFFWAIVVAPYVCLFIERMVIKRMMPAIQTYERESYKVSVLEEVYVGNVGAFRRRLSKQMAVELIKAVWCIFMALGIGNALVSTVSWGWLLFAIFCIFTYGGIVESVSLIKANLRLHRNLTPEECREIAKVTYEMDYASYYEVRSNVGSYEAVLPPKPRYFKAYMVFSTVISVIAILLGALWMLRGIVIMLSVSSVEMGVVAGMFFLYGSLFAYFGVKDFLSCVRSKGNKEIPVSRSV